MQAGFSRIEQGCADAHANWLMDNGDSNPGAHWTRRDYMGKLKDAKHVILSFDGARRSNGDGAAAIVDTKQEWRV